MKINNISKYIFILLLSTVFIFAKNNTYPLQFTFDDNGFIAYSVSVTKLGDENISKEIILIDNEDNYLIISNIFFKASTSICKPINNLNDLNYYENIKHQKSGCSKMFSLCGAKEKIINIDGFRIIVYKSKLESTAFIFRDNNFIALLATDTSTKKFNKILYSIHYNHWHTKYSADYYADKARDLIDKGKVNSATRYLFSATIIDEKNNKLPKLKEDLYNLKLRQINR